MNRLRLPQVRQAEIPLPVADYVAFVMDQANAIPVTAGDTTQPLA